MTDTLAFEIQSLLSKQREFIMGPQSAVLFAQEMAAQMDMGFNRLARVWFKDPETLQQEDGEEITGYDHLIIARQSDSDLFISLWIDTGIGGIPVAMSYKSAEDLTLTPIYQHTDFIRKLTQEEVRQLVEYLFIHPYKLEIGV